MHSRQGGFTLIELVMVIVILGVLAATAVPRFVNLEGDAQRAAVDGMAGALGSGSAINYAVRSLDNTNGVAIGDCVDVPNALEGGIDTAVYEIVTGTTIAAGTTATCTVRRIDDNTVSQTFVGHGIS